VLLGDRRGGTGRTLVGDSRWTVEFEFRSRPVGSASRWRTVDRALPVGVAPERGLQVKTILAARSISAAFPEIHEIGGVRPDPLPWHPNGLALDMIIPNPGTPEGIALGNQIVAFALKNATRFALQDAICAVSITRPPGRKGMGAVTLTTSTSPRPEADTPPAGRSTSARPAGRGFA